MAGNQALFYGDWETAFAEFRQVETRNLDQGFQQEALLGIARTFSVSGDFPSALATLRDLLDRYPEAENAAEAYFTLGQIYTGLDRNIEGALAYDQYLNLRPGVIDHYVYRLKGEALLNAGDYQGAIDSFSAALASPHTGDTIDIELSIARAYATLGDYETALALYADLAERSGNDFTKATLDVLSGQAYFALGENELGFAAYLHAVENYPLSYDSYLALVAIVDAGIPVSELDRGLVDYYAGQYGVAIAAFDRYLATNPEINPGTALYYKGLSLRALENYEGALTAWNRLIETYPADPFWDEAWEQTAYTQWAFLNRYPDAAEGLIKFSGQRPDHPRAAEFLFDAGRILERDDKLDQAARIWEQVAVNYPQSEYAFDALFLTGITQYRLGAYGSARESFQRTLGLAANRGDQAAVHFWEGKADAALGDSIAARAAWERAAIADPTGYYSERARDLLLGREPFLPPTVYDQVIDWPAEQAGAEAWLKDAFSLPPETDLSGLGPLVDDPRILRGTALWRLGLLQEARLEFEELRQEILVDPAANYRLTNYLVDIGLYRTAIFTARQVLTLAGLDDAGTLTAPIYFNHIRFGTYYRDLVNPQAEANNFHPLFIFSVMRQESLFEGFIRSSAGARGLMQIIPTTGQAIQTLIGWPADYTAEDLYRPKVSVTFGTDHLADLRNYFSGDLYATLAAYNAGQGNAAIWRQLAQDDQDLYLEVIRFDETNRYIKGIYEIFNIYRQLYEGSP
jgi:soluble lytic murein transglycosylase